MSLSAMPLILRCTTTDSRPIESRHQCRRWNPEHVAAKAEGHPSAVLGVDGSEWPVAGRLANTATKPLNLSRDRQEQLRRSPPPVSRCGSWPRRSELGGPPPIATSPGAGPGRPGRSRYPATPRRSTGGGSVVASLAHNADAA